MLQQQEVETHTREVVFVVQRCLQLGTLRALQVAALLSTPSLNISHVAASGLQHLALACKRLTSHCKCTDDGSPPMPSINLLTWVRPLGRPGA